MKVRGLLSRSSRSLKELDSLSSSLEKELVQLTDRTLDGFDHVFHTLSAACDISQVDAIIGDKGHRFFPWSMFRELFHVEVIYAVMTTLLEDWLDCGGGASEY